MAESNSEAQRCPCGFYGTAQNQGLCSKCYNEHLQRKTAEADGTAAVPPTKPVMSSEQLTKALGSVAPVSEPTKQEPPEVQPASNTDTADDSSDGSSKTSNGNGADNTGATEEASSSNATKRVRENSECESVGDDRPVQKNKKRCFTCNCKLQPALREIGRCRCDFVFCQLHRLPEQHDCQYDHKETGRKEARDKMVSPKKHMGTSLKRIDSDS